MHLSLFLWQHHDDCCSCMKKADVPLLSPAPFSYAGQLRQHKEKGHLIPETEFHIKDERVKVSYLLSVVFGVSNHSASCSK